MRTPKVKAIVKQTELKCFCGKNTGKVWLFISPHSQFSAIAAHTKCYRKKFLENN